MADQDSKSELSKDVLAPPDEIREDLVATAVKFLENPKVTQSPLSQKKAFLQRKGLTMEEIELAIQRSGISTSSQLTAQSNVPVSAIAGPPPSIPSRQPEPVITTWTKARDLLKVITMVTGISYAAYRLYKDFLRPWLFGEPTISKRLDHLEKLMSESVGSMNTSLAAIEQTLKTQQEKLQMLSHDVNSKTGGFESVTALNNNQGLTEIKSELTSIKGLLLNRRQFPAMPASSPVLPAWQLASNAGDGNSNNKGKKEEMSKGEQEGAPVTFSSRSQADNIETGSPVSTETSKGDADREETVVPEAEKVEPVELKARDSVSSTEGDVEGQIENEVKEPEVKVTDDEDDS